MATIASGGKVETYLGAKAESLLGFKSPKISKDRLHLPGPDFIDRIYAADVGGNIWRVDLEPAGYGAAVSAVGPSTWKVLRSEERRVGKECEDLCRSRWSPYH